MESKPSSVRNGITVIKRIRIRPVTTPYPTLIKWSPPCNNTHTQVSNAVVKTKTHVQKTSSRSERPSQPVPLSEKLVNKHESRKRETNVKSNDKRKEVSKSEHPTGFAKDSKNLKITSRSGRCSQPDSKTLKINQEVSTKSGKQLGMLLEKTNGVNAPEPRIRQSERPIPDIFDKKVKISSTSRSNSDQKSKGKAECKKPKAAITVPPPTNVGETKIPSGKDDILGRPTTECKSNREKLDVSEGGTPDELPANYTLPKSIKCRISRFTRDDVERQITVGQALLSNKNQNSNRFSSRQAVNAPEPRIRQCSTSRSNLDQKTQGKAECNNRKRAITIALTDVGDIKIPNAENDILRSPTAECKTNREKLDASAGGTPDELPANYTLPKSIKCRTSRFTRDDVERQITVGQALLSNKNNSSNRNDTTTERKRSPPVKRINALHEDVLSQPPTKRVRTSSYAEQNKYGHRNPFKVSALQDDVLNQPPTKRVNTSSYDEQNKYEHRNPFKANQRTSCSSAAINVDAFRENLTKTEQSVQNGEGSPRVFERLLDRRINERNPEIRYTAKYKTLILRKDIPEKAGKIDHSVRQLDSMRYRY